MILLDTHVLIWWLSAPEKLSPLAKKTIDKEFKESGILISSISIWEIAMLVKKGKLELNMNLDTWLDKLYQISEVRSVEVDNEIAFESVNLPEIHTDPADRIIIATASILGCPVITKDDQMKKYKFIKSIW